MLEATINNGDLLDYAQTINCVVNEARIHIEEDRLWARAVDPANVAMVESTLREEAFESFDAEPGDSDLTTLGINTKKLKDILQLGGRSDTTTLRLDTETHRLNLSVGATSYDLALIDAASIRDEPDLPDLDLPAEVVVEWRFVEQGINAADMVSDHAQFHADPEGALGLYAYGDTDNTVTELVSQLESFSMSGEDVAETLISLDYLTNVGYGIPDDETVVTLNVGEEFPVELEFDNADKTMRTRYMIAPRINSS